MEVKKDSTKSTTPSRGQINKIYTQKASEQEKALKKQKEQEKTK